MNPDAMPFPARLRPDLRWSPYASDRQDLWVAHDPVHREFFFFSSIEKAIAVCLDGNHSVNAIVQKSRRVDDSVSPSFVRNLIQRLDQASLLLHRVWRPSEKIQPPTSSLWLNSIQSALALRIPLFNPSRMVATLEPLGRILFRDWFLFALPIIIAFCVVLLSNRWSELSTDLLVLQSGMRGDRVLLAALLLLLIKGIHEFGHALACRTVGAECREIGVLFFLGMPCLYCDVSDIWRVPDRWKRMVVSAGGMIVELWIAIAACLIWVSSSTPWVQGIALQVMLLCSLVTIFINANPLLRYDGYYILSDGLGTPNLAEQSREAWQLLWRNVLFGTSLHDTMLRTIAFALFHIVSSLYRYFLFAALIWGCYHWLLQRRLGPFGAILTAVVAMAFLATVWRGLRSMSAARRGCDFLTTLVSSGNTTTRSVSGGPAAIPRSRFGLIRSQPRRGDQSISWFRLSLCAVAFSIVMWFVGTYSFPRFLFARGVIESGEIVPLYARHSAIVHDVLTRSKEVKAGDTLITTVAPNLEMELLQAQGELDFARVRQQQAAKRSVVDPMSTQHMAELEKTVQATHERVLKLEQELDQLNIRSPAKGRFVEPMMEQTKIDYAGRIFSRRTTLGAIARDRPLVERGQQIGELVLSSGWRLRAFVNEIEIDECKIGASVYVRLDQWPDITVQGKVVSISAESLQRTPKHLVGDTLFASTATGPQSDLMPEQTSYSVLIDLDLDHRVPVVNGIASVQIRTSSMTILERWSEMIKRGWRQTRL